MKQILFAVVSLLLMSSGCEKQQENKLPPATQTGANTFGCLMDGMILIKKTSIRLELGIGL